MTVKACFTSFCTKGLWRGLEASTWPIWGRNGTKTLLACVLPSPPCASSICHSRGATKLDFPSSGILQGLLNSRLYQCTRGLKSEHWNSLGFDADGNDFSHWVDRRCWHRGVISCSSPGRARVKNVCVSHKKTSPKQLFWGRHRTSSRIRREICPYPSVKNIICHLKLTQNDPFWPMKVNLKFWPTKVNLKFWPTKVNLKFWPTKVKLHRITCILHQLPSINYVMTIAL